VKKTILKIFLLTFFFRLESNAQVCSVKGRVVDDSGKPVSAAEIYFGDEYIDDVDAIVIIHAPYESGFFYVERTCAKDFYELFITSKVDYANSLVPITPSSMMQQGTSKTFPNYGGTKLTSRQADVGDIKIQNVFQKVKIKLQDENGQNLYPSFEYGAGTRFVIRNAKRKLVGYIYLTKKEAYENSSVWMTLPEGKWLVEIEPQRGDKKTFYPDRMLEISRNDTPLEITLKMSKRK
jgi:hypothetical protein